MSISRTLLKSSKPRSSKLGVKKSKSNPSSKTKTKIKDKTEKMKARTTWGNNMMMNNRKWSSKKIKKWVGNKRMKVKM